jgi:hypothetical protein
MELNLNFLGLSTESLLIIVIILFVIQYFTSLVKSEGISSGKQRFASIPSEGYYQGDLSGADYAHNLNFESSKGPGNVVNTRQYVKIPEGYASVTERDNEGYASVTEGLNLLERDAEGYASVTEGLNLLEMDAQ